MSTATIARELESLNLNPEYIKHVEVIMNVEMYRIPLFDWAIVFQLNIKHHSSLLIAVIICFKKMTYYIFLYSKTNHNYVLNACVQ